MRTLRYRAIPPRGMSAISPIPQLSEEGIEKSGIRIPASRDDVPGISAPRTEAHDRQRRKTRRGRKQADHQVALVREVKKVSWMHQDLLVL